MNYEHILVDVEDGVAVITLNRPEKLNAMNRKLNQELHQAVMDANADENIGCIVITGAGDKAFSAGGDTIFANLYHAYDTLSAGMKAMIADLHTISTYDKKKNRPSAMAPSAPEEKAEPAEHPLVRPHPETGRKALYLCHTGLTHQIVGMTEEESLPILSYLINHATKPEFTCRFRWEVGSMAIWDNLRVLHYPVNDYYGFRRVMHRITIQGERTL